MISSSKASQKSACFYSAAVAGSIFQPSCIQFIKISFNGKKLLSCFHILLPYHYEQMLEKICKNSRMIFSFNWKAFKKSRMNAYLKINVKSIRIIQKYLPFRYLTKKIYTIFVLEIFTYLNVHTYSHWKMKLLKQYCFGTFCDTKTLFAWIVKPT